MKNRRGFFFAFFLLLLVSCNWSRGQTPTPTETAPKLATQSPHIRGTITLIYTKDEYLSGILVEGTLDSDTKYEKAIVGIDSKTLVYRRQGDTFLKAEVTDITINSQVEVLFTGPIRTSDPVQATAEEVIILK
jgi:hypothetical protein